MHICDALNTHHVQAEDVLMNTHHVQAEERSHFAGDCHSLANSVKSGLYDSSNRPNLLKKEELDDR